jgi:glycosyltransferase involved in cell wall biosynthesis
MSSKKSINLASQQHKRSSIEPIRILHVVGGMDRGGAETWLMHILRNIDRDRYHMDFLSHSDGHDAYTEELRSLGSQIFSCMSASAPRLYATNFNRIVQENGPYDLIQVHVHHFSGYVLHLAQQAGIPARVIHSHIDTSSIESSASWQRKIYVALMKWWIGKNSTAGLATSRMAAADLLGTDWEKDSRWQTLYCGVDLSPFCEPIDPAKIRAEFGIPADAIVVGHVGRFESQKNHHFLLEIGSELAKREPNIRLLLIGIGSLRAEIEAKVIQMGLAKQVIFLDTRPDVPRLMKGLMDVFLFPSLYEGLGLVLIEAQAAGLPCVFSDIVPAEADVVAPLIHRLSLQQPASAWADIVLATGTDRCSITQSSALDLVAQSVFNISVSVKELTRFYANAVDR